jgi:hypothetical protein
MGWRLARPVLRICIRDVHEIEGYLQSCLEGKFGNGRMRIRVSSLAQIKRVLHGSLGALLWFDLKTCFKKEKSALGGLHLYQIKGSALRSTLQIFFFQHKNAVDRRLKYGGNF